MMQLEARDFEAAMFAGEQIGEYLSSINKTDISLLSPDEWQQFIIIFAAHLLQKRAETAPF